MSDKQIDEVSGIETTGHDWDGIRELNSPLPRWWLWTFYITIIWAIGYWIAMPAWPLLTDYTRGVLGISQRAQLSEQIAAVKAGQAELIARTAKASVAEIKGNPELLEFALAGGRSAYAVNCSQCHGSGASGASGYPNLNDDDWLWGGSPEQILATIQYGIRSEHDETRANDMPAFGRDEILDPQQVDAVSDYVMALSQNPDLAKTLPGKAMVVDIVTNSRSGMMPAWVSRLDDVSVKQLAVYVHSLGGGE